MALTDVFFRRYGRLLRPGQTMPDKYLAFFRQVAHILAHDVYPHVQQPQQLFRTVHDKMAREMALPRLSTAKAEFDSILQFFTGESDLEEQMSPDIFMRTRLSLLEIILSELNALLTQAERPASEPSPSFDARPLLPVGSVRSFVWASDLPFLRGAINEINDRFRLNGLAFHFHNGVIQEVQDELVTDTVETPFWRVVANQMWAVVEQDMKEAVDHRDQGKPDSTFHALKALESAIKIISDERALTTGHERGAANYVDNLASRRAGGLIASWEAEQLKHLFSAIRNPQGHGPGSTSPLTLNRHQTAFVIESAMIWIKSLVGRL